jgi:acetyl esterase/lipase
MRLPLPLGVAAALCVAAAPASANVPVPKIVNNAVKAIPSMGGFTLGTATLTVSYTDSQATATEIAPTVALGPNQRFQVRTCVQVHTQGYAPDATCTEKNVDTTGNLASISLAAPTVTKTIDRASGRWAYAAAQVIVSTRQTDGSYSVAATSWPVTGLAGAGVAIPAVGALTASLPGQQGPYINAATPPLTGGVNTGFPDSMCVPNPQPASQAPDADISTTDLGTAPAYYEVGQPTGAYAGTAPKGVMVIFHGSAWSLTGSYGVQDERPYADRWRARGWLTINADYRACASSLDDALWFYDQARSVYGTTLPVCASGSSAGGHLALMVAASRQDLSCAIDRSGPSDAASLPNQTAWGAATGHQAQGPKWLQNLMIAAFGKEREYWVSPAQFPMHARILAGVAAHDPYVPYAQLTLLKSKELGFNPNAYVDIDQLADGPDQWFVHAAVSQAAMDDWNAREDALVAPLVK